MTLLLRPATSNERAALEALQRRASLMWEEYRDALLAAPEAIDLPLAHMAHTIVAEIGGEILGFAVTLPRSDGDVELDGLFVEPDRWRLGIGAKLVAESAIAATPAKTMWVIANPRAEDFYRRCGFEVSGTETTQFVPATTMRLAINTRLKEGNA